VPVTGGTSGSVASAPKSKPKAAAHASRPARSHPPAKAKPARLGRPRDGSRLGLPVGTAALAAVTGDSERAALLAAAALLLVAAAAGGLVVGVVGRRLARPV
jgi:hypothetical protein